MILFEESIFLTVRRLLELERVMRRGEENRGREVVECVWKTF